MKISFVRLLSVAAALFLWCGLASAARAGDDGTAPIDKFSVFATVQAQLQAVVNVYGFHDTNKFCVVGYEFESKNYPLAYIYWPIQNKIIQWRTDSNQPILEAGEFWDLTRDILPDGAVTNDYLHPSEVKQYIHDCWKYRKTYIVKKPPEAGLQSADNPNLRR